MPNTMGRMSRRDDEIAKSVTRNGITYNIFIAQMMDNNRFMWQCGYGMPDGHVLLAISEKDFPSAHAAVEEAEASIRLSGDEDPLNAYVSTIVCTCDKKAYDA